MNTNIHDNIILPGYEAQLTDDGFLHSKRKLEQSADELASTANLNRHEVIRIQPCTLTTTTSTTNHEKNMTLNYRCNCTFQILHECHDDNDGNHDDREGTTRIFYAMRTNQSAIKIGVDYFPIATIRIQTVMQNVMNVLNGNNNSNNKFNSSTSSNQNNYQQLKTNLSSASFVSSWNQNLDCIVTFNYNQSIYETNNDMEQLKQIATSFCIQCNITILVLRSKKKKIVVGRIDALYLNDFVYLSIPKKRRSGNTSSGTLYNGEEGTIIASLNEQELMQRNNQIEYDIVQVQYQKPQDAFQHPNHNAMIHALSWMLTKIQTIVNEFHYENQNQLQEQQQQSEMFNLLEMYCGCGAHTMAIAKTGIFDSIVTIELDHRLVEACRKNAELNSCMSETIVTMDTKYNQSCNKDNNDNDDDEKEEDGSRTRRHSPIYIFEGDAGEWSRKFIKKRQKSSNNSTTTTNHNNNNPPQATNAKNTNKNSIIFEQQYSVLLVDPPRAGLDQQVCNLAKQGTFEHIIYISCGREALKRDLVELSSLFEVMDCTLIDLFPRTDSVESLVHLKRKKCIIG